MELDQRELPIENLLFDETNPRLPEKLAQSAVLLRLAHDRKTRVLAEHIAKFGLNPLDRTAVIEHQDLHDRFVVLEGNRRLAALRLLHNPESAGVLARSRYSGIATKAVVPIPSVVRCVVFTTRDDGDVWIRLRHSGEANGAGLVPWNAQQAARYNERTGHGDQHTAALNLLDLALEKRWVSEQEARKVKISHLTRLMGDKQARARLGLEVGADRRPRITGDQVVAGTAIRTVLVTLPTTKVREIYLQEDREKFLNTVLAAEPSAQPPSAIPQGSPRSGMAAPSSSASRGQAERKSMIPPRERTCPNHARCRDLVRELKTLDATEYPNSAAVCFRVLFELSVDRYLKASGIPYSEEDPLKKRTGKVAEDLQKSGRLSKEELQPVRKALQDQDHILSPNTLNFFVHSPLAFPNHRMLLRVWEGVAPFFRAVWQVVNSSPTQPD